MRHSGQAGALNGIDQSTRSPSSKLTQAAAHRLTAVQAAVERADEWLHTNSRRDNAIKNVVTTSATAWRHVAPPRRHLAAAVASVRRTPRVPPLLPPLLLCILVQTRCSPACSSLPMPAWRAARSGVARCAVLRCCGAAVLRWWSWVQSVGCGCGYPAALLHAPILALNVPQ